MANKAREHVLSLGCWCKPVRLSYGHDRHMDCHVDRVQQTEVRQAEQPATDPEPRQGDETVGQD